MSTDFWSDSGPKQSPEDRERELELKNLRAILAEREQSEQSALMGGAHPGYWTTDDQGNRTWVDAQARPEDFGGPFAIERGGQGVFRAADKFRPNATTNLAQVSGRAAEVAGMQQAAAGEQSILADLFGQEFEKTFLPLYQQVAQSAAQYNDPRRTERMAASAMGNVGKQFSQARTQIGQQMRAAGLNPVDAHSRTGVEMDAGEAAARAKAGRTVTDQRDMAGFQARSQALGVGGDLLRLSQGAFGAGMQAGDAAVAAQRVPGQVAREDLVTEAEMYSRPAALGNRFMSTDLRRTTGTVDINWQADQHAFDRESAYMGAALGVGTRAAQAWAKNQGGSGETSAGFGAYAPSSGSMGDYEYMDVN